MSNPTPKNNKTLYIKIVSIILAIPAGLFILFWLFAFQVPQYSYYYVKCGFQQPVKIESNGGRDTYVTPDESGYGEAVLFVVDYYCTEQEAKDTGHERTNG